MRLAAAHVIQRFAFVFLRWRLELQACRELGPAQPRSHVVSKAFVSPPGLLLYVRKVMREHSPPPLSAFPSF